MDKYATHVPVLKALGEIVDVRNVIEFGGGIHSTGTFLDKRFFPKLKTMYTFETDPKWRKILALEFSNMGDGRWWLLAEEMFVHLTDVSKREMWDVIFIDDGVNAEQRRSTIISVCSQKPSAFVVIHDYEVWQYHIAQEYMDHVLVFDKLVPNTAILWNGSARNNIAEYIIKKAGEETK